MLDVREYTELVAENGAYKDIELDILKDTLVVWSERPGKPYTLIEIRDGRVLAGFALFMRAQNTDFTYDIHTIAIDRDYRGKGVGRKLLEMLEEELLRNEPQAIIRAELSKAKEEAVEMGLFLEAGYTLVGHIPSFYETENDYFIYAKHVSSAPPPKPQDKEAPEAKSPEGQAEGEETAKKEAGNAS